MGSLWFGPGQYAIMDNQRLFCCRCTMQLFPFSRLFLNPFAERVPCHSLLPGGMRVNESKERKIKRTELIELTENIKIY